MGMSPHGIEAGALDRKTSSRHGVGWIGAQYFQKVIAHFGPDFVLFSIIAWGEIDSFELDELFVKKPLEEKQNFLLGHGADLRNGIHVPLSVDA